MDTPPPKETKSEKEVEEIAKDLTIPLPQGRLPLIFKLIAFFMLIGGLSIIGGIFADTLNPAHVSLVSYLFRLIAGILSISVAYYLIQRSRMAIWLYAIIVLIGLLVNPALSLLPLGIMLYLLLHKKYFHLSPLDHWLRTMRGKESKS